jgi:hypothetical protein
MGAFFVLFGEFRKNPVKGGGWLKVGVSDGKIEDITGSIPFFQYDPFLEHLPYHGLGTKGFLYQISYGHENLLFLKIIYQINSKNIKNPLFFFVFFEKGDMFISDGSYII